MILRTLVCIPTYNNPETIAQVTRDALQTLRLEVLVVDDGSQQPVLSLFTDPFLQSALANQQLQVLRWTKNRGKGHALQSTFAWALERGFTHVLTLDGDGQHLVHEATKVLARGVLNPFALVIGKRQLGSDNVPGITHFGRSFSNFWVRYQSGQKIEDSQSGFRLYPLFALQNRTFFTQAYDFEIEVLIRTLWSGTPVEEVEIQVYYPPAAERISHFDKLWDNVRISLLNTAFVIWALFMRNLTTSQILLGLSVGGASSFFPFSFWLGSGAISAALLLRLNLPLILLSTFVFRQVSSALELGFVVGLTSIVIWLLGKKRQSANTSNWTGKTRGGRLGNGFLKLVLRGLGLDAGYFCLYFIVPYFYIFAPQARRSGQEYWRIVRPDLGVWQRQGQILKQLYRFGQVLMDRGVQSFANPSPFVVNTHGLSHLLNPLRARQPLALLTAHAGGWDLAAMLLQKEALGSAFHMVHYQSKGLTFEKILGAKSKNRQHIQSLAVESSPILQIKTTLENGEPIGFMGDRAGAGHFELVPFFGRLAPFDTRPFRIAAACVSPVVFTFAFKGQGRAYELYALPALSLCDQKDRPRHEQIRDSVALFAKELEAHLKLFPEQWFNFYPFFSNPPKSAPGLASGQERHHLWQVSNTPKEAQSELEFAPKPTSAKGSLDLGSRA